MTRKALERFSESYRRSQAEIVAWKQEAHSLAERLQARELAWRKVESRLLNEKAELRREANELHERVNKALAAHADPRAFRYEGAAWRPEDPAASSREPKRPARIALSIVLGTYNRLETCRLTIDSIRRQGLGRSHEIIVVDGGSTDGTIEWLSQQTDIILILQHNRIPGREKRSWGYFMNLAFKAAEGKYVLMLSDDCLVVPGSIEHAVAYAEHLETEGRPIGGVAFYFRNWPSDRRYFVQCTLGGMLMVNHGLFTKEALTRVGFAEEDLYNFYKADSDLALKIWHAGYEIVACPNAFVEHLLREGEELRITNNVTLAQDRNALIDRWRGIYVHPHFPDAFYGPKRIEIDFVDPNNTVAAFEGLNMDKRRVSLWGSGDGG